MEIKGKTLSDAWPKILDNIFRYGQEVEDERGQKTLEVLNLVWTVTDSINSKRPSECSMGPESMEVYIDEMIDSDQGKFVYTYGNRLQEHFEKVNQIQEAINRLKNCKESRRAISVTWDPFIDSKRDEVPCMMLVDFKIRHKILYTTALWRSHDAYGAIPANFLALKKLSEYVADNIGVKIGPITVHSISAHIYEHNWAEARRVVH